MTTDNGFCSPARLLVPAMTSRDVQQAALGGVLPCPAGPASSLGRLSLALGRRCASHHRNGDVSIVKGLRATKIARGALRASRACVELAARPFVPAVYPDLPDLHCSVRTTPRGMRNPKCTSTVYGLAASRSAERGRLLGVTIQERQAIRQQGSHEFQLDRIELREGGRSSRSGAEPRRALAFALAILVRRRWMACVLYMREGLRGSVSLPCKVWG